MKIYEMKWNKNSERKETNWGKLNNMWLADEKVKLFLSYDTKPTVFLQTSQYTQMLDMVFAWYTM